MWFQYSSKCVFDRELLDLNMIVLEDIVVSFDPNEGDFGLLYEGFGFSEL